MPKIYRVLVAFFIVFTIYSCSKKTHPTTTTTTTITPVEKNDSTLLVKKSDSLVAKKPAIKRKPKEAIPKVITVNDKAASKSVDGRLYYDLQGHRYWRSNKDGKYYLYNKSMNTDEAFKKPH